MTSYLETYLKQLISMRLTMPRPNGYPYVCFEDYVLDRGKPYLSAPLTPGEERIVKTWAKHRKFPVKLCFHNSQVMICDQHLAGGETPFRYVEGFCVSDFGLPIHHGWLSLNGKVVDLTLRSQKPYRRSFLRDRAIGEFREPREYIGVEYDSEFIIKRIAKSGKTQSVIDDWENDYPELRKERIHEHQDLRGVALPQGQAERNPVPPGQADPQDRP